MPEKFHGRFANSVRLYALALREVGVNDELAFIHLVSAIEILSKSYRLSDAQDPLRSSMDEIKNLVDSAIDETVCTCLKHPENPGVFVCLDRIRPIAYTALNQAKESGLGR
ncbi:hypothetical protein A2348_05235 [Candidatus Uhrbacteria bacterium RIFOXYB12_FULL_58_10]|uniref:Uncharacterized protein n=1 Tax=Candidatus Uhrbacteria bacterium RIFOXYB2_FULL_57_15 TaxID=1802422 RepID=A0A1F7W6A4_9BACT|nr:MAG: hypothetical protein A2348_05235 [Candidatus Uhrbacteria bacterium RIFOXYB12_FULL_58_10]OGL97717.1 MAG: hypothetical protein A2304_00435 [Candidatus Uhrbacteria bacterium RIFOXYB2_FULL_57_15]OGM00028.1 MAG: hypothetical protein A2501_03700 [Candidatus Uhrbacteria bacterium RIFOXYC12_FULL_57_11]